MAARPSVGLPQQPASHRRALAIHIDSLAAAGLAVIDYRPSAELDMAASTYRAVALMP